MRIVESLSIPYAVITAQLELCRANMRASDGRVRSVMGAVVPPSCADTPGYLQSQVPKLSQFLPLNRSSVMNFTTR